MADIPFKMGDERATIASTADVNGTKVYVGHSMTPITGSVADAEANYPGAVKDGKIMTYSFDRETMAKSRVASMFQSQAASSVAINDDMLRNVKQMRDVGVVFNDYDRGIIQGVRDDLAKRTAQDPGAAKALATLDQMVTAVAKRAAPAAAPASAPVTSAPAAPVQQPPRAPERPLGPPLTAEENRIRDEYDVKHGTLMSSLTPQQKALYDAYLVAPTEPGRISAAETKFSVSLSIEQLNLFDKVRNLRDQITNGPTPVAAPAGATPPTVPVDPNRPVTPPPAAPTTAATIKQMPAISPIIEAKLEADFTKTFDDRQRALWPQVKGDMRVPVKASPELAEFNASLRPDQMKAFAAYAAEDTIAQLNAYPPKAVSSVYAKLIPFEVDIRQKYETKEKEFVSTLSEEQKKLYEAYRAEPKQEDRVGPADKALSNSLSGVQRQILADVDTLRGTIDLTTNRLRFAALENKFATSLSADQLKQWEELKSAPQTNFPSVEDGKKALAFLEGLNPAQRANFDAIKDGGGAMYSTVQVLLEERTGYEPIKMDHPVGLPVVFSESSLYNGEFKKMLETLKAPTTTIAAPKEGEPGFVGPPAPKPFVGPPAPKFELSMETGGKYTVNPQVQAAQQIMADLKKAGVAGIELGATGAAKNGVDGQFGPKTRDSIIAVEKALGIDPPTGKLTTDLVEKMKVRAQELAAKAAPVAAPAGATPVGPAPAPSAAPVTPAPATVTKTTAAPATAAPAVTTPTPTTATPTTATPAVATPTTATPTPTPPPAPAPATAAASSVTAGPPAPPAPKPISEARQLVNAIRDDLRATPQGREIDDKKMSGQKLTLEDRQFLQDVYDRHGGKAALEAAKARDSANGFQKVSNTYDPINDYLNEFDLTSLKGGRGKLMYANDALHPELQGTQITYGESLKGDPQSGYQMVAALLEESGSDAKLDPDAYKGLDQGSQGFDRGLPGAKLPTMSA